MNWVEKVIGNINIIVMGKMVWFKFYLFKFVKGNLDIFCGSFLEMEIVIKDFGMVVSFKGYFGDVVIWVYIG